jgi:cytochrome c-type biogenesis protein CcmH
MGTFLVIAALMAAIAAAAVALPLLRNRQSRLVGAAAAVAVVGAAAGLYPLWSNWDWRAPVEVKSVSPQVLAMVAKLEKHMQEEPNDLKGWLLLGRSDLALQRIDDAILAYDHARRLDAANVEAMLGLGEAVSIRAGGNITPAAVELFEHAVALAPDDPRALLYSGFAAATRGDRATARSRWMKLKSQHPPPEIDAMLDQHIAELGAADLAPSAGPEASAPAGAAASATAAASAGESGTVAATVNLSIAPALRSRLTGDAPLFVFAREPGAQGPPLAAKRLTSSAIGTQVRLSSADSMIPGRVLVAGQKVSITARISFSGQPIPAAGDLYGELTYDVGHDGVRELVIDRVAQ